LGEVFDLKPNYFSVAGGMISRPDQNALLLMTHPGGAGAIDYDDYWDGDDLIYTGRGKRGDQRRVGQNRDLGDNSRDAYVFEPAGPRELRFLGKARCVEEWTSTLADVDGNDRSVLRFRLRFRSGPGLNKEADVKTGVKARSEAERAPRPFDPQRPPKAPSPASRKQTPEETQALREKAVEGHHELVSALSAWLTQRGWSEIEEIPLAIDLWARTPNDASRVIFEAKTVRPQSESDRVRAAIAQLLEYRFFYGANEDRLCLVCDRPISDRRVRLLDDLGIVVLWWDGEKFAPGSSGVGTLLEPQSEG